jgi:hypothetical protein
VHASKRARRYGDVDRGEVGHTPASVHPSGKGSARDKGKASALDNQTGAAAVDQEAILESASRFCQTAAELQLLGVWRPVKRQRVAAAALAFK